MKQLVSSLLASSLILSLTTVSLAGPQTLLDTSGPPASATLLSPSPESDFTFKDGQITKYTGPGGAVVIPSTINGQAVTSLGSSSFYSCKTLTSVVIPEGVTTLTGGSFGGAFAFCTALSSVTLPDSVSEIGTAAFYGCTSLTSLTLPAGLTSLPSRLFSGCSSLEEVILPESLLFLGDRMFEDCLSLTHVTIPDRVAELDYSAFYGCSKLLSITLPKSVTAIGSNAVFNCPAFTTVQYTGSQEDREKISISSLTNTAFLEANWIYDYQETATPEPAPEPAPEPEPEPAPEATPEASYPSWAEGFVGFVSQEIMPDISPENCQSPSNRGLIAQSLYNMSGETSSYTSNFEDAGAYADAIGWCFEHQVMAGNSESWFNTEANVTREQFALILRQLATVNGLDTTSSTASLDLFSDKDSITSWAAEGVAWAVEQGLMAGNQGQLNPGGDVTRLEVAVMLKAFAELS